MDSARDTMQKILADLQALKDSHPETYLELLRALNKGVVGITEVLEHASHR